MLQRLTTPDQYHLLQNAGIPRTDIPPINCHKCYRALVLHISFTCGRKQIYPIGNLTYSDLCFAIAYTKHLYHVRPTEETTPQKHRSWMNNRQVTQITYAALYKHEDYFQCRPIYSYPSTTNLMYYNTKVLLSRNRQMY